MEHFSLIQGKNYLKIKCIFNSNVTDDVYDFEFSKIVVTLISRNYNILFSHSNLLVINSKRTVSCRKLFIIFNLLFQEDQDWGFVAMVLDRLFLWIFIITSIAGTISILCEAPALYDDTKPIDTELSSVAQQQFLPEFENMQ